MAGLLCGLLLAPAFAVADALTVQTTSGPVRGFSADGMREFRAIPYAASTAGDKRWTAPVPPAHGGTVVDSRTTFVAGWVAGGALGALPP